MTKFTGVCSVLLLFCSEFIKGAEEASEESLVKKLTAVCGKDGIKVNVRFSQPFKGVVYSDGHYDTPHCIFVDQENNATRVRSASETRFSFVIPADECGTKFHDPGSVLISKDDDEIDSEPVNELANEVYMENTVMFQQSHLIQEQGDLAQTLRCVWQKEIRRPLHATLPLAIRGKHRPKPREEVTQEKKQYLQSPLSASSFRHTVLPPRNVTKESTYLTASLQQRHADIRKRFQGKGQVESVTYGNTRRSGKSLTYRSPVVRKKVLSDNDVILYQNPPNITALPFKADETSGAAATRTAKFVVVSCNPTSLLVLLLLNLPLWTFYQSSY